MADIDTGDVMRLVLDWAMPEQTKANTVLALYNFTGECTDAEMLTALAAWVNTAFSTLQTVVSDQVDLDSGILSKVVWSGVEWITDRYIGTILPTFTATDNADMLPHASAAVVTFPTLKPKKRGRVFLPGFSEAQQGESVMAAGAATAMANFATALLTPFSPGTAGVYYSVIGLLGQTHIPTGFDVNGLIGSQRRRKPGVGI